MKKVISLIFILVIVCSAKAQSHSIVEPLLKTQWGQGVPYYSKCPLTASGEATQTGCVATALAQILNYWQHPAVWKDRHDYSGFNIYSTDFPKSLDLSQYAPAWSSMLNTYSNGSYSMEESAAVSDLMFYTGYVLDMAWGSKYSDFKDKNKLAGILAKYMDYNNAYLMKSPWFTNEEIKSAVLSEIAQGRPVLCMASKGENAAGHAFVIDGVDSEGKVHVNWGWEGVSDDYYDLFDMKPAVEGVGNSTGTMGYVCDADYLLNICPQMKASDIPERSCVYLEDISFPDVVVATDSDAFTGEVIKTYFTVNQNHITSHDTIKTDLFRIKPRMDADSIFHGKCYVRLHDTNGSLLADSVSTDCNHTYNFPQLADGKYFMTFYAYHEDDDVKDPLYIGKHDIDTLFIERNDGGYILSYPNIAESVKVSAEPIDGFTAYSSNMFKTFSVRLTNQGKRVFHQNTHIKITGKDKATGKADIFDVGTLYTIPDIPANTSRVLKTEFYNNELNGTKTMGWLASKYDDLKIGIYIGEEHPIWQQPIDVLPGRKVPEGKNLVEASFLDKDVLTNEEFYKSKIKIVVNADTVMNFWCYVKEEDAITKDFQLNCYQGDINIVDPSFNTIIPPGTYTFILKDSDDKETYFSQKFTIAGNTPSSVVEIRKYTDSPSRKSFKVLDKNRIVIQHKGDKYNVDGKKQ